MNSKTIYPNKELYKSYFHLNLALTPERLFILMMMAGLLACVLLLPSHLKNKQWFKEYNKHLKAKRTVAGTALDLNKIPF